MKARHDKAPLAKLTVPRPGRVYLRRRLFNLLDARRSSHPVIWISAPGGAGKTTLVSSYLREQSISPLWYSIDETDSDPASFFYHLRLAAKPLAPRKKALPLLTPEYLAGLPVFTRNFFRALFAQMPKPAVVVLDNYQEAPETVLLHDLLSSGFGEIPEGVHVVVLSRAQPPAAFTRLIANDQVAMLDWQALQLTEEEAHGIAHLRSDDADIDAVLPDVLRETRGWVAGLVLLLEQTREQSFAAMPGRTNDLTRVFDYFANETFRRSPADLQIFLLTTAFLPKMTLAGAERVTGNAHARRILEGLTRRNYFTTRHADGSYEYHPLFRAFLLNQASEHYSAADIRRIQHQCAQALVADGDADTAATLLLQTEGWAELVPLLLAQAPTLMEQGRLQTLSSWLFALPQMLREQNPWLLYWLGVSRLFHDQPEARSYFERAFRGFEDGMESDPLYLAWAGIVTSVLIEQIDYRPMEPWLDIFPTLASGRTSPSPHIEAMAETSFVAGLHLLLPDSPYIDAYTARAELWLEKAIGPLAAQGASLLVGVLWMRNFGTASRLLRLLDRHARSSDTELPIRVITCALMSLHAYFLSSHEECIRVASEGLTLAEERGVRGYDEINAGLVVLGELSLNGASAARRIVERFLPAVQRSAKSAFFMYCAASISLQEGNLSRALEEITQALHFDCARSLPLAIAFSRFSRAVILARLGNMTEALIELDTARISSRPINSPNIDYCDYLAEANIRYWSGERELALQAFTKALQVIRDDGRVYLPPWQLPQEAAALCDMALARGIETDFVFELIRRQQLPAPLDTPSEHWPFPVKIYTLGRFSVVVGGEAVKFSGKTQKKPLELLKLLIALGGRDVAVGKILDVLWPDADGDAAAQALRVAVHRLRKLLGNEGVILVQDAGLSLDARYCWVDIWIFERLLASSRPERGVVAEQVVECARGLALYKGPFLGGGATGAWAVPLAERLRLKFLRYTLALGDYHEAQSQHAEAAHCYQRGIDVDDLVEEFYRRAIVCYQRQSRPAEARAVYERYRAVFKATAGMEPSVELRGLLGDADV